MKKLVIILILTVAVGQLSAQDAISEFFGKYQDDLSFTHVSLNSRMFGLFTNLEVEDEEDQEVLDAISKIKGLKILAKEDASNGKELYAEAFKLIPRQDYDELMSVRSEGNDMKFLIKEKGGTINELLMIMGGDDEFFILSLIGDIDLNQIARLSSAMDIDGLENLKNLDKRDNDN